MNRFKCFILIMVIINVLTYCQSAYAVDADGKDVSLKINIWGTASQNGQVTFFMNRVYSNDTDTVQYFDENVQMPIIAFSRWVPDSDVVFVSEGLMAERYESGYRIFGELNPGEEYTISLMHQTTSMTGNSRGRINFVFSRHIDLAGYRKNIKLDTININFVFPPGTTSFKESSLVLGKWDETGLLHKVIEPVINSKLLNASWLLSSDHNNVDQAKSEDELTLEDIDLVRLNINYEVNINTLPIIITYLAIGIGVIALIHSLLLSRRIKNLRKK